MSFQSPAALLWAIPLWSIIIALYLLKMRRRDVTVPATFLWPARTEEIRANALFQKLKPNLLMFLQLLAATAVVLALARPQLRRPGLTGEVTVLIVDTSASMSATDVKPSRFAEAVRTAEQAVQAAHTTDRIAIIEAGSVPRVVAPLSSDSDRQLVALRSLEPSDSEADTGEALRLASALVGSIDGARIVLISDGVFNPVTNFSRGKAALVYKSIGRYGDNLAIAALGYADAGRGRQLYCSIKNYGLAALGGTVTIYADGVATYSSEVPPIAPGKTWAKTVAVPTSVKVFEAKLDANDILKADNYAVVVAGSGSVIHTLVVGKGDPFLERALVLDPRVNLDKAETLPSGSDSYDLVIFDNGKPVPVKSRGVMVFGAQPPEDIAKVTGSANQPTWVSSENGDLMRGVDLHSVFIEKQPRLVPIGSGRAVAQSTAGPIIITSDRPAQRTIYVAFEPLNSDWPLQFSFPIFIANSLDFFTRNATANLLAIRPGVGFNLVCNSDVSVSGEGSEFKAKAVGSVAAIRGIRKVGKYRLRGDHLDTTAYASLTSERESRVTPAKDLNLGGGEVHGSENPARFTEFWRPMVLLLLLLLGSEWWVFAKRS